MSPVFFHPDAGAEALDAAAFYESQQPGLGARFVDAVAEVVAKIQAMPQMYPEVDGGARQARIASFPFGIIYRPGRHSIDILAVMHLRRDPGYWRTRSFEASDQ